MGIKDRDDKFASYLTTVTKNREGVTAVDEGDFGEVPIINLLSSQSAQHNVIVVLPKRVTGSGDITIQLWRLAAGYTDVTPTWTLSATSAALGDTVEARFQDLLAAKYQLVCSGLTGEGSWDIYEAHTEK